jgi:anti-anti-sigma factor
MGGGLIDLITGDGYVVVALSGEVDLVEAPALRKTLDELVRAGTPLVLIDAAELSFIDSTGIGILVATHNQLHANGGMLAVANLGEKPGRPVRLTEVDTAIPVHWADDVVRPWAESGATGVSILVALGLADAAVALASGVDVDAEPIA